MNTLTIPRQNLPRPNPDRLFPTWARRLEPRKVSRGPSSDGWLTGMLHWRPATCMPGESYQLVRSRGTPSDSPTLGNEVPTPKACPDDAQVEEQDTKKTADSRRFANHSSERARVVHKRPRSRACRPESLLVRSEQAGMQGNDLGPNVSESGLCTTLAVVASGHSLGDAPPPPSSPL